MQKNILKTLNLASETEIRGEYQPQNEQIMPDENSTCNTKKDTKQPTWGVRIERGKFFELYYSNGEPSRIASDWNEYDEYFEFFEQYKALDKMIRTECRLAKINTFPTRADYIAARETFIPLLRKNPAYKRFFANLDNMAQSYGSVIC